MGDIKHVAIEEVFAYLDNLSKLESTNMYYATLYVQTEYQVAEAVAEEMVYKWRSEKLQLELR